MDDGTMAENVSGATKGSADDWKLPGPKPKVGDQHPVGILNPDGTTEQVPGVVSWVGDSSYRVQTVRDRYGHVGQGG